MLLFRRRVVWLVPILCAALFALRAPAQGSHWDNLNSQVVQLFLNGKYDEAAPLAKEALKVAEADFGPKDARAAVSLTNIALLSDAQKQYDGAEPLYQRALKIEEDGTGAGRVGRGTDSQRFRGPL
ncbi:MAG: tetratricopeptide repeat protein [Terracidiphilus sp.]